MRNKIKIIAGLFAFTLLNAGTAFSATFYISPLGSDSAGTGTVGDPWKTAVKAFQLGGGNTYVFKDGVYDYVEGMIVNPPSGTPANPTVIKAQNYGAAVLDGGGVRSGILIGDDNETREYITIEGFKIINTGNLQAIGVGSPDGTAVNSQTNHITIRQTGGNAHIQSANEAVWGVGRARDCLFEDVWAWGEGRYTMILYGCTRITVRRAVLRWDGWGQGANKPADPKFNMGVYDTHDSLIENVLILDHQTTSLGGDVGGLYLPGNDNGNTASYTDSSNNRFFGLVILKNYGNGIGLEGGSGLINQNNAFSNVVLWGNSGDGFTVPQKAANNTFTHITIGKNGEGTYFGVPATSITNSLVTTNTGIGLNGIHTGDYNNVVENGANYDHGAVPGAHSISKTAGLKYITRIEAGSNGKGAASDGGDMGANVVKRYADGVLTTQDLWPWPLQERIKADMCAGVTRGFCGSASITEYVWGQLGFANPYGGSGGTPGGGGGGTPTPSLPPTSAAPLDPTDKLRPRQRSIAPNLSSGNTVVFGEDAKKVTVINSAGQQVWSQSKSGPSKITWNGRNESGAIVESGYYMCRIEGPNAKVVYQVIAVVK